MMGTTGELHYACLARYERRTGFGEIEPSGNYHFVAKACVLLGEFVRANRKKVVTVPTCSR